MLPLDPSTDDFDIHNSNEEDEEEDEEDEEVDEWFGDLSQSRNSSIKLNNRFKFPKGEDEEDEDGMSVHSL